MVSRRRCREEEERDDERQTTMKTRRQWGLAPHGVSAAFLKPLGIAPAARTRPRHRWRLLCCLLFLGLGLAALRKRSAREFPIRTSPVFLTSWSFTDTNYWVSDWGYSPLSFTNLSSSTLGNGPALVVDSSRPRLAAIQCGRERRDHQSYSGPGERYVLVCPFWAGTNEGGTGPGEWSRLIEVGAYTTNASYGWWSFIRTLTG